MKRTINYWSQEECDKLVSLWNTPATKLEISRAIGRSIPSLEQKAYQMSIRKERPPGQIRKKLRVIEVPKWVPPVLNLGYQAVSSIYGEEEAATWARTVKGNMK